MTRRGLALLVLLVPGVTYVWLAMPWQRQGLSPQNGDEPRRLFRELSPCLRAIVQFVVDIGVTWSWERRNASQRLFEIADALICDRSHN